MNEAKNIVKINGYNLKCAKLQGNIKKTSYFAVRILSKGKGKEKSSQKGANSDKKLSKKHKFILLLSGGVIGFLNGFFGGGGGMICVPILQKVLSLDAKQSHASAIAVIYPLSLISAFIYVINGYIASLPLLTIGLGEVAGGLIGAICLKVLPPKYVQIIFAIVMFAGGIKLII